jgi:pilus assembly protein FimV
MNRGSPVRKLPARKLLGAIIATALFLPETAFTLGLGEIEVHSALNQKLSADIELLSAEPEETEGIIVKLASRKEFTRAGLDRPYLLNDLRFKSEIKDGVPHISVSSGNPIREPFLNFLVEIDWPKGHMIREYTVLLDPPVFMTQSASPTVSNTADGGFRPQPADTNRFDPVVAPVTSVSSTSSSGPAMGKERAVAEAPVSAQPQAVQAATNPAFTTAPVLQQSSFNQPLNSYRVRSGDTAWSLAKAMRPDQSISVEQMMIAMLRANPESFIKENVNGLKRGYILRTPDYNQIVSISQRDARALVIEQAALWRQYQQMKAGAQPTSAMSTDDMSANDEQSDSAIIDGEEDEAYLEIVSAGSGSSSLSGKDPTEMSPQELRAELAFARERVETERVEKEALQERISSLEQNVSKMKGMLSIEDDELSDVQALGSATEEETDLQAAAESDEMAGEDINAGMTAEDEQAVDEINAEIAAMEAASEDGVAEEVDAETEMEAESEVDTEVVDEEAVFLDETISEDGSIESEELDVETVEIDQSEDVIDEVVVDEIEPAQEEIGRRTPADPLQQLLDDPILLAAAGGGLLLILAVIALISKRRKAAAETDSFEPDAQNAGNDDLASVADEVAAETEISAKADDDEASEKSSKADDDIDLEATLDLGSAEDTTDDGAEKTEEDEPRDDVIAEADVYLAYGIYQQAEELLTQAIADSPERNDYRVKLAETHYASKNADAFVEVASEIRKRSDGENTPEWKKILVMGQDLCSDNALFQGTMVGGLDVDALSTDEPTMDFDLGIDEEKADDTSALDLSLDDEPLELPETDSDTSDDASADKEDANKEDGVVEPAEEIEFDISDSGASEETTAEEDEFSLDIDASELDIDTKEETDDVVFAEDEVHELDTSDDPDLDFGLDDVTSAEKTDSEEADIEEEISLDLTDDAAISDLDLSTDDDKASPALDSVAPLDDDEDFDLSSLDDVDEISTKLDLARAYLDMGDNEGTREILEEVLAEGSDEQKQEANELMSKLD